MNIPHLTTLLQKFTTDTRGVSIPIEYVIGFGVLVLLTGGFTTAIMDINDSQEQAAIDQELNRITNIVTHSIEASETIYNSSIAKGSPKSVASGQVTRNIPQSVNGGSISISISANGEVTTTTPKSTVTKYANVTASIEPSTIGGGSFTVTRNESGVYIYD